MNRLTAFSFCAALAGAALVGSAAAEPATTPPTGSGDAKVADTIHRAVHGVFQGASPAVVRVESEDELGKVAGTGFFVDATGTIYTLASVVGDGLALSVARGDERWPAKLLTKDPRSGIALIKIDGEGATPFLEHGDCQAVRPSSPLVVVGYPFDHEVSPSFGVVGGLDRKSQGQFFTTTHIRANIPVQRGQGGSPVLNLDGQVVGVLVSGFESGAGCYVLPIRAAEKVRRDHARFGEVRHGWAGVTLQEIPVAVEGSRMVVDVVDPAGPAAGQFRSGDVVLQVGEIEIREPEDALDASFFLTAGDPVDVRVARGGKVLNLPFTPAEHPSDRKSELQALGPGSLLAP